MLPEFLVEETTVREAGESDVLPLPNSREPNLTLTFGITHAMEHQSIEVDIFASRDGIKWSNAPVARFTQKYYCGTYQLLISGLEWKYLKAAWRVTRWGKGEGRPFFRFYLFLQDAVAHAAAGVA